MKVHLYLKVYIMIVKEYKIKSVFVTCFFNLAFKNPASNYFYIIYWSVIFVSLYESYPFYNLHT